MPGGDRSGPMGMGPMTGRGMGPCAGGPAFSRRRGAGYGQGYGFRAPYGGGYGAGAGFRRGRAFGYGRPRGRAYGYGYGRGYARPPYPYVRDYAGYPDYDYVETDPVEDLKEHIACLEEELELAKEALVDLVEEAELDEEE